MHITKFFYNVQTKECEFFVYSGCGGNANNFMSAVECESTCKKGSAVLIQIPVPTTTSSHQASKSRTTNTSVTGSSGSSISNNTSVKQFQYNKRTLSGVETSKYFSNEGTGSGVTRTFAVDGEDCKQSQYGCCEDGNTPAAGENKKGCPEGNIVIFGQQRGC